MRRIVGNNSLTKAMLINYNHAHLFMKTSLKQSLLLVLAGLLLPGCMLFHPFTSRTMTGWEVLLEPSYPERFKNNIRAVGKDEFPEAGWEVDGDTIKMTGEGQDVMTFQMFEDFAIEFEWKVDEGASAGVLYRVVDNGEQPSTTGAEYRIQDDRNHPDGDDPLTSTGAVVGLLSPSAFKEPMPPNVWNYSRLSIDENVVIHRLNGQRVVNYLWNSERMQELIQESRFADNPDFMKQGHGYLVFKHHTGTVWFRNIRIRRR